MGDRVSNEISAYDSKRRLDFSEVCPAQNGCLTASRVSSELLLRGRLRELYENLSVVSTVVSDKQA
jgi:hypothetical protein